MNRQSRFLLKYSCVVALLVKNTGWRFFLLIIHRVLQPVCFSLVETVTVMKILACVLYLLACCVLMSSNLSLLPYF